jgi:hypothetical protein
MYTGSIKVKFNVSRINFSRATTTSMDAYYGGSLPEQPSDAEIFGWFINNNSSVFGTTTNITQNDVDFGSYASENRTLSVKAGNEY